MNYTPLLYRTVSTAVAKTLPHLHKQTLKFPSLLLHDTLASINFPKKLSAFPTVISQSQRFHRFNSTLKLPRLFHTKATFKTETPNPQNSTIASKPRSVSDLVKQYGKIGIVVHFTIGFSTLALFYSAIRYGVDVSSVLAYFGIHMGNSGSGAGTFAIALICNKAIFPIRLPITLAVTPIVARYIKRRDIKKDEEMKK